MFHILCIVPYIATCERPKLSFLTMEICSTDGEGHPSRCGSSCVERGAEVLCTNYFYNKSLSENPFTIIKILSLFEVFQKIKEICIQKGKQILEIELEMNEVMDSKVGIKEFQLKQLEVVKVSFLEL